MAHTRIFSLYHCAFSTKERHKCIDAALQPRLWAYLGGIAKQNGMQALAVGGTDDHVHILLRLSAVLSIAKALQLLKGGSSKWVHEIGRKDFAWQSGYGAFTVGISQKNRTIAYIQRQIEHHKKVGFQEEFIAFLKKHKIEYDPRYLWG